jgi:hypothetical protein
MVMQPGSAQTRPDWRMNVMANQLWKRIRTGMGSSLLAALILTGSPNAAEASAAYNVWYFDDVFDTFTEGDISDGWTKLVPPAWACGLRFYDPSYYRWVNGYGGTISSEDFAKDVTVWIPKPGCPGDLSIEYTDGSQSFPHVPGASYMEITTNYAVVWVDEDGGWPPCDACVGPGEITYFPEEVDWASLAVSAFKTTAPFLLDARTRSGAIGAVGQLLLQIRAIYPALQAQIADRRRLHPLGDREQSVQTLENAALRGVFDSVRLLEGCSSLSRAGRFVEAYAVCTLAGDSMDAAGSLIQTAQYTFQQPTH